MINLLFLPLISIHYSANTCSELENRQTYQVESNIVIYHLILLVNNQILGVKGLKHISETLSDAMNAILSIGNDVIFFLMFVRLLIKGL